MASDVMGVKPGGPAILGPGQPVWVKDDLKLRSASTPLVVFVRMPLWTIYEAWGWGDRGCRGAD